MTNNKSIRLGHGGGKDLEEGTKTVGSEVNTDIRFVTDRSDGEVTSIIKRLPYSKIKPEHLSNKRLVQYGVFFTRDKNKFEEILYSLVPDQKPDQFKAMLLEGNVFEKLQAKKDYIETIKKEFGEETYKKLWMLPRKYLDLIKDIGKNKKFYEKLSGEEANLKRVLLQELEDLEKTNYTIEQKNKLAYLIRNCGFIFNTDLVVGLGKKADIKLDLEGISKVQGLISESDGFGTLDWLDSGRYGTNSIHFTGRYDSKTFTPLKTEINKPELIDLENKMAQLTYLSFFGDESDRKPYGEITISPIYVTFLKAETRE